MKASFLLINLLFLSRYSVFSVFFLLRTVSIKMQNVLVMLNRAANVDHLCRACLRGSHLGTWGKMAEEQAPKVVQLSDLSSSPVSAMMAPVGWTLAQHVCQRGPQVLNT